MGSIHPDRDGSVNPSHRLQGAEPVGNGDIPINNPGLEGDLKALYMLLGDVKGGGPFPPIFNMQLPMTGGMTNTYYFMMFAMKNLVNNTDFLAQLKLAANPPGGGPVNAGIKALYNAFTQSYTFQDGTTATLIDFFKQDWTYGKPGNAHLMDLLEDGASPLCAVVYALNHDFSSDLEKDYQPPAGTEALLSDFNFLSINLKNGNGLGVAEDIRNITAILSNPAYENDGFIQMLSGLFVSGYSGAFNASGTIQGTGATYTGYSLTDLANLVLAHPSDTLLQQNFLKLFNQPLDGGGASKLGGAGTWAQMFENNSGSSGETGIGNFLAWYMFDNPQ